MKAFGVFLKVLAALATVAGIVYVVATYGDKIVAWARKLLNSCCCCCDKCDCDCDCVEAPAEEPAEKPAVSTEVEDTDFEN